MHDPTPVSDSLATLLGTFGLAPGAARQGVEEAAAAFFTERGIEAEVRSLRWGVLTVSATPPQAALVTFEYDQLIAALDASHPGCVSHVSVHTE
jgi:hypothetical protein